MALRVETEKAGDRTIYRLEDTDSRASASISPSFGFNLFDLRLPVRGEPVRVIDAAADWAAKPSNPGRNGIPVLFPFPNRIRDGRFIFQGKSYDLPKNNGPNAIHGFAIQAAWDVVEQGVDDRGAFVVGRYRISKNTPQSAHLWPTDAILEIRYALKGSTLALDAKVSNPTAEPLPFGFGIHPYFRLPFDPAGEPDQTRIVIPAERTWTLNAFLPTGETPPVDDRLDFRNGKPRTGLKLDDVLTGLIYEGSTCRCRMIDLAKKTELVLSFDKPFREIVAYTPPDNHKVIALEPYTQTTDAINLAAKNFDAGLITLDHDGSQTLAIRLETKPIE